MSNSSTIICPLCNDTVDKLLYRYHLGSEREVIERIKLHNPEWTVNDGACSRCVDYYHTELVMQQRMLPEIGPYFPIKSVDDFIILPTGLRLDTDPRYTGKGVTICFIDSDFCPHPDLVAYKNRIKAVIDLTMSENAHEVSPFGDIEGAKWHGTMTSVVCAGDGYLSNGLYRGIASDAELVLLKVQDSNGHISDENIVKALQWVSDHQSQYNIRIVNMSIGADNAVSYKQSEIDQLAEKLIECGITIVAAAGNDENGLIKPPANSLNVITVGGIDDNNQLEQSKRLYHSTYGSTVDELMKPELTAPAIWIAAPMLPGANEQNESAVLHRLIRLNDEQLLQEIRTSSSQTGLTENVSNSKDVTFIREAIKKRLQTCKYISEHYMHVDGTSFAAPMVSAVIAQLLEADPSLSPAMIREVLFSTAKRIEELPAVRQGFGFMQPKKALLKVLKNEMVMKERASPYINSNKKVIEFYVQHSCADHIALAGSFNHWANDTLLMEPCNKGLWKIQIPMLPAGKYHYKFFVDDKTWIEDVCNPYRVPDGFSGFNSILIIEN